MTFADIARALVDDPEYRLAFTRRLADRTVDEATVSRLVAYARSRQTTMGHAVARRVLTEAGISWEAL